MRQYRMPPSLGIVLSEALKIKIYDHDESDVLLEIDGKEKKILWMSGQKAFFRRSLVLCIKRLSPFFPKAKISNILFAGLRGLVLNFI